MTRGKKNESAVIRATRLIAFDGTRTPIRAEFIAVKLSVKLIKTSSRALLVASLQNETSRSKSREAARVKKFQQRRCSQADTPEEVSRTRETLRNAVYPLKNAERRSRVAGSKSRKNPGLTIGGGGGGNATRYEIRE